MRTLTLFVFSGMLAFSAAADDHKDSKTAVAGCLTKDAMGGYMLMSDAGKKVSVMGTAELEKHSANHTVKLHGSEKTHEGKAMFHADRVEHVSETCKAPAAQ